MKNYFVMMCTLFVVNSSLHAMDTKKFRCELLETLKDSHKLISFLVDIAQSEQPDLQVAQKLVGLGVDIASDTSGKITEALWKAVKERHYDYVKFLLDNKADVNSKSLSYERTALMEAVFNCD